MRYARIGLLLLGLIAFASAATAAPISLAALGSGTIVGGDKTYGDFSLTCAVGNCAGEGITTANILVEAFLVGDTGFLQFSGDMISGTAVDFLLRYTVTSSGPPINMIDQSFNLSTTGGGSIIIGEDVRTGSFVGPIVANSSISFLDLQDPAAEVGDNLNINPPQQKLWVTKDINITPPAQGGLVGTSLLTQSFHQVPEPTSLLLLGTGLAALGIWRKRAK